MPTKYTLPLVTKLLLYTLFIGVLVFVLIKPLSHLNPADITGAALDLSDYDFESQGLLCLNGQWEFYYQKLLPPANNEENAELTHPDKLVAVPSTWNTYNINGKNPPGFGYASYRLHIKGIKPDQPLALKILEQATAYNLYVDDELILQEGKVSTTNSGQPGYRPHTVILTPHRDIMAITLQISNNTYARGGMWDAPTLGTVRQMNLLDSFLAYRDTFLLGNYFVMFLLCMTIFIARRKNRSSLYFAVLCLVASGRVLIYGDFVLAMISDNFRLITIIEYLTRYWYPFLLLLLVESEFPETNHVTLTRAITAFVLIVTCITVVTPIHIFTSYRNVLMTYDLVLGLYIIAVLLLRAHSPLRWLALLSIGMIFMFTVCDMFIIPTSIMELNVVGFYVMMLSFAFILTSNYAQALKTKQNAYKELQISNERERQSQLKFLQSQIKPNFLYNVLTAIANVCSKDAHKAEELILDLAFFLQASFDFTEFNRMSTLAQEIGFVHNYISIEKVRFPGKFAYDEQIEVPLSTQLPRLVIQPLVENAIRHGLAPKNEGGEVRLRAFQGDDGIHFEIWDNGVGMDNEKLTEILNEQNESRKTGLSNIHERLAKIYGQGLAVESSPDHGTRVSFIIDQTG